MKSLIPFQVRNFIFRLIFSGIMMSEILFLISGHIVERSCISTVQNANSDGDCNLYIIYSITSIIIIIII